MASRYWVGGAGNWDASDTTHWASSSGGAGGASVPTSADDVIFDTLSNATDYTCTVTATANCLSLTLGNPLAGALTFAGSSALNIYGNLTIGAGITRTYSGTCTLRATSGTKIITSNGVAWTSLTFNGSGGTFQLADQFETGGSLTLTAGSFDANGQTVLLSGIGTTHFITGAFTFFNLTKGGTAGGGIDFLSNITISGTFAITQTSRIYIKSNTTGTARTLTVATNSLQYADFRDITAGGAANWDLSAITGLSGDCGGNTGITFTTSTTQTNTGATGNWNDATKWTSRVPLPQDDVVINTGSGVITGNVARLGRNINFTGFNGTFTSSTLASIFGSLTLATGMTVTASAQTYTFEGRSTHTITSAGKSWAKSFNIQAPGGTYTLQDNFVTSGALSVGHGTFDANDFDVSVSFVQGGTGTNALIMGNGIWSCSANNNPWFASAIDSITAEGSTIKITDTSNANITFTGGTGKTYNNVWFNRGASTGNITVSGSNTFNEFKDTGTAAHSILFAAASTQHITTWTVSGTAGNLISISSTTTGIHTLVKDGGGIVSADYLDIEHSVATPADTWFAGNHSTDNQSETSPGSGWIFSASSASSSVSLSPSASQSPSASISPSPSASQSPSSSDSSSPSASASPSQSVSSSPSASQSPSSSDSLSPSISVSASPSATPSSSVSLSPSSSPSLSVSLSPSVSVSLSISLSPSLSPSASPSASGSDSTSASISLSPSASISPTPSPSVSASPSPATWSNQSKNTSSWVNQTKLS